MISLATQAQRVLHDSKSAHGSFTRSLIAHLEIQQIEPPPHCRVGCGGWICSRPYKDRVEESRLKLVAGAGLNQGPTNIELRVAV